MLLHVVTTSSDFSAQKTDFIVYLANPVFIIKIELYG
jgi:hypothetical protein